MALICRLFLLVVFLTVQGAHAAWSKHSRNIMGTRISVEFWHADQQLADQCGDQVFTEFERIDRLMSVYRPDSEVAEINREAALQALPISDELVSLIRQSLKFSELSNGAFDITYASIGYRYDFRQRLKPSDEEISQNLSHVDYRKISLGNNTIRFAELGMRIDLGGIAKGYAVDRAIDIARQCGIENGIVTAGGDSRIIGDRGGRPWMIGIQHPRDSQKIALKVPLDNTAISTSGDYERFFVSNGERIHHIIDPETGKSANRSWSASVIGPDAITTDALSTTLFIMGPETGMALINSLPEVDAIIIDNQGKVLYSAGLMEPGSAH